MCVLAPYLTGVPFIGDTRADMITLLTHHGLPKTANHCLRVAEQAHALAVRFGEDERAPQIAGWLHDISAIVPNAERVTLAEALDLDVLDEERCLPMIVHQKISRVIARDVFAIDDTVILSAVGCHTTLRANASRLDKVVFVADKIAWDQAGDPPYLPDIVAAADRSLDETALCYIEWLWAQRDTLLVVHPWLVEARGDLLLSSPYVGAVGAGFLPALAHP